MLKNAMSNSITNVTFLSLKNYLNSSNELANHLINIGISYKNSVAKDIVFLETMNLADYTFKSSLVIIEQARLELIAAFTKPNENRSNGQKDAYIHINEACKVHVESGKLYIYGYSVSKQVIKEGEYKVVKSSELTIAKNELRKLLKTGKFKQFSLEVGNNIKANGETLEL
jgi:hypothetical protein